ncbi:hypothetical protein SEEM8282_11680 [Salmonella enterica subsp. enterica serovar Montevideo str. IA_2010008282]|nr:hypothetical protein SEEM8282_11680 [Salmonella enterica subsp. enterica serovar Montevideo str. IA_2010008282]
MDHRLAGDVAKSATDTPIAAAILHNSAMLGLALQPSISTSIPLLTPERRASSSSDIFFWSTKLFDTLGNSFIYRADVGARRGR